MTAVAGCYCLVLAEDCKGLRCQPRLVYPKTRQSLASIKGQTAGVAYAVLHRYAECVTQLHKAALSWAWLRRSCLLDATSE